MNKLAKLAAVVLVAAASFGANAVDFSSDFTTGTKQVKTTGDVKITGAAKEYSKVSLKGIKGGYEIAVYPCSNCAGDVDKGNDYTVVGDYKSWSNSTTQLDITQTIDNTSNGTICDVNVELGAFKAGNSTEKLTSVNITTTDNQSITTVKGGDKYVGEVFDNGVKIGDVKEGSSYEQNIKTNLQTITTENTTTLRVKSYIGG